MYQECIIGSLRKKGRDGNRPRILLNSQDLGLLDMLLKQSRLLAYYTVRLRITMSHLGQSTMSAEQKVCFPLQTLLCNPLTCQPGSSHSALIVNWSRWLVAIRKRTVSPTTSSIFSNTSSNSESREFNKMRGRSRSYLLCAPACTHRTKWYGSMQQCLYSYKHRWRNQGAMPPRFLDLWFWPPLDFIQLVIVVYQLY